MKVIVIIPKHQNLEVKCRGKSTLPHIKTSIFNAYGLFANFYKLYYKGTELDDDVTPLKDLGITDGSFINLIRWNEPAGTPQFFKLDTDLNNCERRQSDGQSINFNTRRLQLAL